MSRRKSTFLEEVLEAEPRGVVSRRYVLEEVIKAEVLECHVWKKKQTKLHRD